MFDKYRIVKKLGSGGSATIYLAEHIKLESFRAIKCIRKDNVLYQNSLKEAYILKNLKHSNIPIIYDIEEDKDCSYIIEEYIEGISLESYRLNQNYIQEDITLNFSMQICELIQYLHENEKPILYLDLKPENIMVSNQTLKLIDFGTATYLEDTKVRKYLVGTKGYAAPEQYHEGSLDERCDVYSIGMILFFLVTGITFDVHRTYLKNIDEAGRCSKCLKRIINKCLKYYPSQRYPSVIQLHNRLSELKHKNLHVNLLKSQNSLKLSFAGSQKRIGTTHISLMTTSYINKYIARCIYREENECKVVKSITNRYKQIEIKDEVYSLYDCNIIGNYARKNRKDNGQNQITIKDYGMLTQENLNDFLSADIKVLILGAKEWELESAERVLNELIEYNDIIYLFNYVDGKTFREVLHNMGSLCCYRVPYVVNPYRAAGNEGVLELVQNILRNSSYHKKRSKINQLVYKILCKFEQ